MPWRGRTTTSASWASDAAVRSRGFTLLELLVALAIVAVLLGLSAGLLSRLGSRNALEANQRALRALLRRARNASREERFGAVVEFERGENAVVAQQRTAITHFRFEAKEALDLSEGTRLKGTADDDTPPPWRSLGARGHSLVVDGGEQVVGRYGLGVLFAATGPLGAAWAHAEERPVLNPREGVFVECWVYLGRLEERLHERPRRARPTKRQEELWSRGGEPPRETPERLVDFSPRDPPIFYAVRKGRAFSLGVTAAYEVEVAVTGPEDPDFTYIARTRPGTLRPDRWYRLAFSFDGRTVRIFVNGIPRAYLPCHRPDTSLFEELDGAGASEVIVGGQKLPGREVLDEAELAAAGELGERLRAGADRGGEGNGDGLVTRSEFLARVPSALIADEAPLICSDPHPDRAFYGVIDELRFAGILRSERLPLPDELVVVASADRVHFDFLGQLDPTRHPEPFVILLSDDERAYSILDPPPEAGGEEERSQTRARRAEEEVRRRNLRIGRAPFERFLAALERGDIDPNRVRRLVVQRTGLVRE